MKTESVGMSVVIVLLTCCCSRFTNAQELTPDLRAVPEGKGWKGNFKAAKLIDRDGAAALEFNSKQNVLWLDGVDFRTGTIEFDAKGKSRPWASGFVGVAVRVVNQQAHDAVYFRPFNFRAADADSRSHAVQYVSHPKWTWQKLRKEKPGQFEKPIDPAPDGDAWLHVKIVVKDRTVKVFVNGATKPSLVVDVLSDHGAVFCIFNVLSLSNVQS
ncbi:MAG: hypothetical protein ABGZ23_04805 [Fuerstiella sp.]|nr:hypothetical protein [Fuerstiella sp.]